MFGSYEVILIENNVNLIRRWHVNLRRWLGQVDDSVALKAMERNNRGLSGFDPQLGQYRLVFIQEYIQLPYRN